LPRNTSFIKNKSHNYLFKIIRNYLSNWGGIKKPDWAMVVLGCGSRFFTTKDTVGLIEMVVKLFRYGIILQPSHRV
jgi:hypothetical protein